MNPYFRTGMSYSEALETTKQYLSDIFGTSIDLSNQNSVQYIEMEAYARVVVEAWFAIERFVNQFTGDSTYLLERLARIYNVERAYGESDESLRDKIRLKIWRQGSAITFGSLQQELINILDKNFIKILPHNSSMWTELNPWQSAACHLPILIHDFFDRKSMEELYAKADEFVADALPAHATYAIGRFQLADNGLTTILTSVGSATIIGQGTKWLTADPDLEQPPFAPGDELSWIDDDNNYQLAKVVSVVSDAEIVVDRVLTSYTTFKQYYRPGFYLTTDPSVHNLGYVLI